MDALNLNRPAGVFAAVLTPFTVAGAPDSASLALHCRWLLSNGCDGLSVLGTTGEANSLSVDERIGLLERLVSDGIPAKVLMPGTGCCAISDTVRLTQRAVHLGVVGVLMLPPFYYKNVSDDGIFAAIAEVIQKVGDSRLRIYLYHFPQMTGVPFSHALIERLRDTYPETVVGMKDSSGDLANMTGVAKRFANFDVFSGSDELLLPLLRSGGAGCITGVSNVAARLAAAVFSAWRRSDRAAAEEAQARLTAVRKEFLAYPLSAALKEIVARHTGRPRWRILRPPLTSLPAEKAEKLADSLERIGFALAALP
ncbi:MAG: dihydrodipicolinate synthase family protein [Rhodospirillales bacterium]|nr:dihydrodipicolinate synthase family protein [Rhodospirillales bacterium]